MVCTLLHAACCHTQPFQKCREGAGASSSSKGLVQQAQQRGSVGHSGSCPCHLCQHGDPHELACKGCQAGERMSKVRTWPPARRCTPAARHATAAAACRGVDCVRHPVSSSSSRAGRHVGLYEVQRARAEMWSSKDAWGSRFAWLADQPARRGIVQATHHSRHAAWLAASPA